jgi:hypothetical protein
MWWKVDTIAPGAIARKGVQNRICHPHSKYAPLA